MKEDLISVIIPIYNVEKYLDRCVESVINQTYKNLEIILVDDGSSDNCPKICDDWKKRDNRIKVIHKQNGGLSDARNAGIEIANGKFIGFVDSDDYIEPIMYECLYKKIINENSNIALCSFTKVFPDKKIKVNEINLNKVNAKNIFKYFVLNEYILKDEQIYTENVMASAWRCLYKSSSIGSLRFENFFCEDIIFNTSVIKPDFKISTVSDSLYNYYFREESIINSLSKQKVLKKIEFIKRITFLMSDKIEENYLSAYKFYLYKSLIVEVISYNNKDILKDLKNNEFFKNLNDKNNYKCYNKITKSKKKILSNFLIHYNMFKLYKIIKK